eukprot:SAG31_NODE_573_length_13971_cov_5.931949_10_plen_78_part_00
MQDATLLCRKCLTQQARRGATGCAAQIVAVRRARVRVLPYGYPAARCLRAAVISGSPGSRGAETPTARELNLDIRLQ